LLPQAFAGTPTADSGADSGVTSPPVHVREARLRASFDRILQSRRAMLAGALLVGAMTALAGPAAAQGDGLKVLAAGSALHGLRPAAAQFARESGIAVVVATDHGHNIRKHALAGQAQADVVLVPTEWAEEIVAAGRADKSTMLAIGAVRMGAVVKAGAPRPDVSSMDALRRRLLPPRPCC
jgi:molybdate transport system substrate-binding protein